MSREDEKRLIEEFLETGEAKLLDQLYSPYVKLVYNFILRMTKNETIAEDATQEALFKAWKNMRSFNTSLSFKTWLLQIAKNSALDILRKKKSIPFSWLDNETEDRYFSETIAGDLPDPEEESILSQESGALRQAIASLPTIYQEIFLLKLGGDMSLKEISEIFEESENTIKSRYLRGLNKLKNILQSTMHRK